MFLNMLSKAGNCSLVGPINALRVGNGRLGWCLCEHEAYARITEKMHVRFGAVGRKNANVGGTRVSVTQPKMRKKNRKVTQSIHSTDLEPRAAMLGRQRHVPCVSHQVPRRRLQQSAFFR